MFPDCLPFGVGMERVAKENENYFKILQKIKLKTIQSSYRAFCPVVMFAEL